MVKFVWLDMRDGGQLPVNPDQVQYLRQTRDGGTAVVFGALQGAMHELIVAGDGETVAALLEAATAQPATGGGGRRGSGSSQRPRAARKAPPAAQTPPGTP